MFLCHIFKHLKILLGERHLTYLAVQTYPLFGQPYQTRTLIHQADLNRPEGFLYGSDGLSLCRQNLLISISILVIETTSNKLSFFSIFFNIFHGFFLIRINDLLHYFLCQIQFIDPAFCFLILSLKLSYLVGLLL